MVLCGSLRAHAAKNPQAPALLCGDAAMSFAELDASSDALARWLLEQGLRPGDRVALHWSNSIEVVQLFFALFKAGLIAVTVNIRLKPAEIRYILDHSESRMCFSEPALAQLARDSGAASAVVAGLPQFAPADSTSGALPTVDPDQPAVILYTSGTTARPKGVVHTHRSLYRMAVVWTRTAMQTEAPGALGVRMCALPLMHAGALAGLVCSIYSGERLVLLPRFQPSGVLDTIERFECTALTLMPALWRFVLEEQARTPRRVSSLRWAGAGGDAVPVELQSRFESMFGIPLQEGYALTESVPMMFNPIHAIRPGALGMPLEGVEVRIVDWDGREVPEGETGEIAVRSPANCVGYWNDPEATRVAIRDGWLYTGDLASRDADGYYWFKGRKKEIIIRAGSNISPQEVEEALYRHPAVLETGVVGAPDPAYGEIVVAFVALREGQTSEPEELIQFARKYLADYKVPERVVFLPECPKSPTGKVHRRTLKEMLLTRLAHAERGAAEA
jgi:long-chain acyl-CoA synthetase